MSRMLVTVGALAAAVLTMSGCAASAQATEAAAAAPVAVGHYDTPAEAVPLSPSTTYLVTMRGLLAGQERHDQTDAQLIASGKEVCANEVAAGLTWESLDKMVKDRGLSVPFYRAYVQAAVEAFCPGAM